MASVLRFYGEYDPEKEDIECYLERFNEFCKRNQLNVEAQEATKKSILLETLGAKAYTPLRQLSLPIPPGDRPWNEVIALLTQAFKPVSHVSTARYQFDLRIQKKGESFNNFLMSIQHLASQCDFGTFLNTALTNKIIHGIASPTTRERLMEIDNLSLEAAIALCRKREQIEYHCQSLQEAHVQSVNNLTHQAPRAPPCEPRPFWSTRPQGPQGRRYNDRSQTRSWRPNRPSGNNAPPSPHNFRRSDSSRGNVQGSRINFRQCFRCGNYHDPSTCPVQYWTCNACHQRGHRARCCPTLSVTHHVTENSEERENETIQTIEHDPQVMINNVRTSQATEETILLLESYEDRLLQMEKINEELHAELTESKLQHTSNPTGVQAKSCNIEAPLGTTVGKVHLQGNATEDVKINLTLPNSPKFTKSKKRLPNKKLIHAKETEEEEILRKFVNTIPVYVTQKENSHPHTAVLSIEGNRIEMEIDCGSGLTIMSLSKFKEYFPQKKLEKTNTQLGTLNGPLQVVGECRMKVLAESGETHLLPLVVVQRISSFTPLLGRSWLDVLIPNWRHSLKLDTSIDPKVYELQNKLADKPATKPLSSASESTAAAQLAEKYPQAFSTDRSKPICGFQANIRVKPDAIPYVHKDYQIPLSYRPQVEKQLLEMVSSGILVPVSNPEWASPIWPIPKADGTFRICADFKKTINPYVLMDHCPIPKIDEVLTAMAGAKWFTVLDLTDAYMQLEVAPESRKFLTINTRIGFFQYTRLIYGLSSAPALFQGTMDLVLKGIDKICCYLDDVIIWASSKEELTERMSRVFKRLDEHNVRVNPNKCQFFKQEVEYLGHVVSSDGIKMSDKRVQAIRDAPIPRDVTTLRSFLGSLTFYAKFIPNLSAMLKPLYNLLQTNVPWKWTQECQLSFETCKNKLLSNNLLVHYDPLMPIFLQTDASPYGIAAIMFHIIDDEEKPVMCFSATLTKTQEKYSQIEKEALAIISGVTKFHKFLIGRHFTLVTDNQPLKALLEPTKGFPIISAQRIQRWAITLAAYDYSIKYRKSKDMGLVDTLSRLPLHQEVKESINYITATNVMAPLTPEIVAAETDKDQCLSKVKSFVQNGWPIHVEDGELAKYLRQSSYLSTENGCLMFGARVVIPPSLRELILHMIHENHPGIVRSKMIARETLWWPGLNRDIEDTVHKCDPCALMNFKSTSNVSVPWPSTYSPWQRLHLDFFEEQGKHFLLIEDSYSKWIDLHLMTGTRSRQVIQKLRNSFSYFTLPTEIVTDGGPPFNSTEFTRFCTDNAITCTKIPPYHPSSNGLAERGNQTVKRALKKFLLSSGKGKQSLEDWISKYLFSYRNTPSTVTGVPPVKVMLKIRPRTLLTILNPLSSQPYQDPCMLAMSKPYIPRVPTFNSGDIVKVRLKPGYETRMGKVIRKLGPTVYFVDINGTIKLIHINQMQLYKQQK